MNLISRTVDISRDIQSCLAPSHGQQITRRKRVCEPSSLDYLEYFELSYLTVMPEIGRVPNIWKRPLYRLLHLQCRE